MNGKSTETNSQEAGARDAIIRLLESRNKNARFVTEISATLARSGIAVETSARVLAQLSEEGAVMVRDHFCADPHLAGVDLRIAAIMEGDAPDAEICAIRAIDAAWDKWLGEYLANHRCS
jgi:hypothetical protein